MKGLNPKEICKDPITEKQHEAALKKMEDGYNYRQALAEVLEDGEAKKDPY